MNVWSVLITLLSLAAAVLAGVTPLIAPYLGKGRKLLVWRVLSDNPAVSAHHAIESRVQILLDGQLETDLNLLVLNVESAGTTAILGDTIVRMTPGGNPITINDYNPHIRFSFEGREVLDLTDIKTEPDPGIIDPDAVKLSLQGEKPGYIELPATVTLNHGQSIHLSILLKGARKGVKILGGLKNGEVRTYEEQKKRLRRRNRIAWGIAIPLVGVAVTIFFATLLSSYPTPKSNSNPLPPFCTSGNIAIGGSTAIEPFIAKVVGQYESKCPKASITINQGVTSSKDGLSAVEAGHIDIGSSDLRSLNYGLVDRPILVVPYVIVVSQDVSINNLTTTQLQDIYDGKVTNWNAVGNPESLPIMVVSRTSTSGTRKTFEQYALGKQEALPTSSTHLEVGTTEIVVDKINSIRGSIGYVDIGHAISANLKMMSIENYSASLDYIKKDFYKFWAVEHLYTKGNPSGLTEALLTYINSDSEDVRQIRDGLHYVNFNDVPSNLITIHASLLTNG